MNLALTKHKIHIGGINGIAVRLSADGVEIAAADLALPADLAAVKQTVDSIKHQATFHDVRLNGGKLMAIAQQIEAGAVE